ncbi:Uma2 family endonuclease [Aerosakkonema funiforme]|uniref:Uma2 family endonuclease n=1 Tax=Aerosakkonema funiforme FACHB-1375 TaxID=2949571 RepID=A0A926VIE5_9CYAN|nr:Uma2 family endonuclease [Aerosakkonema funiforme]MBD2184471.1 Uma2 family endonuclease [Aerosakkonema funiforme FACHB-1375]
MLKYKSWECLPPAECLPDSDDKPVDNELQDLIPHLLKTILAFAWANRWDWFFGVDMGIYYDSKESPIAPDGFLSLGVERFIDEELRSSYVFWEENYIAPIFVLEVVSHKPGGEYKRKKDIYAKMGVLYYAVYNPLRRQKPPLEVRHLVNGSYNLLSGNPIWLPEINLGIGIERGTFQGITREWLYWYNEQGQRLLTPEEQLTEIQQVAQLEFQRRQEAERRAERLAERLRNAGIEPD